MTREEAIAIAHSDPEIDSGQGSNAQVPAPVCTEPRLPCEEGLQELAEALHGLFTFLEYQGVEPTNNSAERGGRPAVQWRKICFGNQSHDGELLTARLLTAERSCALQGRNPFKFLLESVTAHRNGLPAPSLVQSSC